MANIFQNILVSRPRKSVFNLDYENKLSFDMGYLIPIYKEHVIPGDKFKVNSEVFLRFAPMIFPVMHRIDVYVHYFFVPYRIIWDDWQEFITGGADGLSAPVFPRSYLGQKFVDGENILQNGVGTLADYLGYNFTETLYDSSQSRVSNIQFSLLPFRAYQKIYNEYYRDQNLSDPVPFSTASGMYDPDTGLNPALTEGTAFDNIDYALNTLTTLRMRAWEKDYFTSALPFVQRGVAAQVPVGINIEDMRLYIPQGGTAIETTGEWINGASMVNGGNPPGDDVYIRTDGTISTGSQDMAFGQKTQTGVKAHTHTIGNNELGKVRIREGEDGVIITAPTINELRLAEHIQRWLERNARGGARYIEQILSHFGVRVPDYRLDRPEYLGGGKAPVTISEVLQTSSTDSVSPQGSMAGHGYSLGTKNKFKYSFDEHGIVLGILSVLPRTAYMQGVSRHERKFDKFDYAFPEFANLGEQSIENYELYNNVLSTDEVLEGTFGYQERYAEYKYRSGEVHGDFKSNMRPWHMARYFGDKPVLSNEFVTSDPTTRIFAVEYDPVSDEPINHMWCQVYNSVRAVRPLPKHAMPSI